MLVRQQNPHGACRLPVCRFGCPRRTRKPPVSQRQTAVRRTGETSVPTSRPKSPNPDMLTGLADIEECHAKEARELDQPRETFFLQGQPR